MARQAQAAKAQAKARATTVAEQATMREIAGAQAVARPQLAKAAKAPTVAKQAKAKATKATKAGRVARMVWMGEEATRAIHEAKTAARVAKHTHLLNAVVHARRVATYQMLAASLFLT